MKKFNSKALYYFPFNGEYSPYLEAYKYYAKIANIPLHIVSKQIQILTLPLFSTVIVESINSIKVGFFARLDVRVIHCPRGGGSLKVGWSTLNKLSWHVWLRLYRRTKIVVRNDFFARYQSLEEKSNFNKYVISREVVDDYFNTLPKKKYSAHIALSECWSVSQLNMFLEKIVKVKEFEKYTFTISIHPMVEKSIEFDRNRVSCNHFAEGFMPELLITDCVSIAFNAFTNHIKLYIVEDNQSWERRMLLPQKILFNIKESDVMTTIDSRKLYYVASSSDLMETSDNKFQL